MPTDRKKAILIVLITAMTLVLSVVAIATAWKLRQVATVPITPNAPQSIPKAVENPSPTPTPQLVCTASFDVAKSSCDAWCNEDADCETGMSCLIAPGQTTGVCRNPTCTSDVDCLCPDVSPTPSPTGQVSVTPSLTPVATSTPSPTNGPTSALTSTPRPTTPASTLVACNGSCTNDEDCSGTNVCQGGMCRNASCSAETDCTCGLNPSPTVPTLPQAGSDMPTLVLLSMGTIILLAGLVGLLVL